MEHDVYICGWSNTKNGFQLWVQSRPHVRVVGQDFADAEQALLDAIRADGGALQPVLEFSPPLPSSAFEQRYSHPELLIVCGDECFETDEPRRTAFETDHQQNKREDWCDQWFVSPCCRECRQPLGPRNDRQLTLTSVRSTYDGGFVRLAGATISVFSQDFLDLLSQEEQRRLEFRPVQSPRKSRKQYFELVGPTGAPPVAPIGLTISGWVCNVCGSQSFGYWAVAIGMHEFIASSDLPIPLPTVFVIGVQPNLMLCMTRERWSAIVGRAGARGVISRPLGVVQERELVRHPKLKTLQEQRQR